MRKVRVVSPVRHKVPAGVRLMMCGESSVLRCKHRKAVFLQPYRLIPGALRLAVALLIYVAFCILDTVPMGLS